MQNYKMILEYEGTRYNGWQRQGNTDNTIQGILERELGEISGEAVEINGSGRTDAGVHAAGQCASFRLETELNCDFIKNELNKRLNRDIRILRVEQAHPRFHARLNAKAKTYVYRICTADKAPVFTRHFTYLYPCKIDIEAVGRAADMLVGEHDFRAFTSNHRTKKSTVRTIYSIDTEYSDDILTIRFTGNGFLYNMVRIISGSLLMVGTGEMNTEDIALALNSQDRKKAGVTLPSSGLMLEKVYY